MSMVPRLRRGRLAGRALRTPFISCAVKMNSGARGTRHKRGTNAEEFYNQSLSAHARIIIHTTDKAQATASLEAVALAIEEVGKRLLLCPLPPRKARDTSLC